MVLRAPERPGHGHDLCGGLALRIGRNGRAALIRNRGRLQGGIRLTNRPLDLSRAIERIVGDGSPVGARRGHRGPDAGSGPLDEAA